MEKKFRWRLLYPNANIEDFQENFLNLAKNLKQEYFPSFENLDQEIQKQCNEYFEQIQEIYLKNYFRINTRLRMCHDRRKRISIENDELIKRNHELLREQKIQLPKECLSTNDEKVSIEFKNLKILINELNQAF